MVNTVYDLAVQATVGKYVITVVRGPNCYFTRKELEEILAEKVANYESRNKKK